MQGHTGDHREIQRTARDLLVALPESDPTLLASVTPFYFLDTGSFVAVEATEIFSRVFEITFGIHEDIIRQGYAFVFA